MGEGRMEFLLNLWDAQSCMTVIDKIIFESRVAAAGRVQDKNKQQVHESMSMRLENLAIHVTGYPWSTLNEDLDPQMKAASGNVCLAASPESAEVRHLDERSLRLNGLMSTVATRTGRGRIWIKNRVAWPRNMNRTGYQGDQARF